MLILKDVHVHVYARDPRKRANENWALAGVRMIIML